MQIAETYVPHAGWFRHERHDEVATFLAEGWFEYKEQAFLRLFLRPGDAFLDCGAHVGLFSVIASRILNGTGLVIAVEPHSESVNLLKENLISNQAQSFRVRHCAITSRSGTAVLHQGLAGKSAYSSLAPLDESASGAPVETLSIDELLESEAVASLQLAKIDVEGAELEALCGAAETVRHGLLPLIIIECTEANLGRFGADTQALFRVLRDFGYSVCRFDTETCRLEQRDYNGPIGYDNLFAAQNLDEVNERLANSPEASARIAYDILNRGKACEAQYRFGLRTGDALEQTERARFSAEEAYTRASEANWRAEEAEKRARAAEQRAEKARAEVQKSERRAEEDRKRLHDLGLTNDEAFRREGEANWRAEEAEKRAQEAEQRTQNARAEVQQSERRAEEDRKRLHDLALTNDEAFRRQGEANWRAEQAEKRAQEAERRAENARAEVQQSERRAEEDRKRLHDLALTNDEAFRRQGEANWRAEQAEKRAQEAEQRAENARAEVQQSERRAEEDRKRLQNLALTNEEAFRRQGEANWRAEQAERRTAEAEQRTADARRGADDLMRLTEEYLKRSQDANWRAEDAQSRSNEGSHERLRLAHENAQLRRRLRETVSSRYLRTGWLLHLTRKPAWLAEMGRLTAPDESAGKDTVTPESEMSRALRHLSAKGFHPNVVLDIGAGKGHWSLLAGRYFSSADFYMIEALVENEPDLQVLSGNGSGRRYILTAVGDTVSTGVMHVDTATFLSYAGADPNAERPLPITTIDKLIAEGRILPPDLVRIDVRGAELRVLQGAQDLFRNAEVFIIAVNLFAFMPECPLVHDIVRYMAEREYYLFDIAGCLRRPHEDDLGQLDLVMASSRSPLLRSTRWD